jgi:hypothetical protein
MNENKINQSLLFSLSLLLGLSACFFIPEFKIFGVNIKSINVFSDITKEIPSPIQKPKILIKKEFIDSCPKGMTCIEDYSKKKDALNKIFDALQEIHENKSKVRIAFFGDSFIEGDILTAEVRKKLQNRFGGGGVGFVPIASEVSGFRQTIFHRHNNINAYNIINHSKAKLPFAAGGYCFYPLANNYVTYAGISKSTRLKRFNNIRVFYETSKELPITYTAHQKATIFNTKASNKIEAHAIPNIKTSSISFNFPPSIDLKLYGVSMEDSSGVVLDNFGMKSNSGINLIHISDKKHKEFDSLQNYKLIVLQYGLNAVGPNTTNLNWYIKSMTRVVKRIKRNYPNASILMLSVSDRGTRQNGVYKTMSTIPVMIEAQRKIAKDAEVAFWDMFTAIGGENTIINYAQSKPALANKDYTHLTFKGGEKVAEVFSKTFLYEYKQHNDKKAHMRSLGTAPQH